MSHDPYRIPGTDRELEEAKGHLAALIRTLEAEVKSRQLDQERLAALSKRLDELSHAPTRPQDLERALRTFRAVCKQVIGFCLLHKQLREKKCPSLSPSVN